MDDNLIFTRCIERANRAGIDPAKLDEVIIFLGKEIDRYRDKINQLETLGGHTETLTTRLNSIYGETLFEAAQESTTTEIIKALADNGYNTITINCYKDIESEG